jgi:hypothetical protein
MRLEDRSWVRDGVADQTLDEQLAALPDGWCGVDAVDVGDRRRPLGHVLVGPGGVLTVLAATHPQGHVWVRGDGLLVDGQWMPYLRDCRRDSERLERVLSTALGAAIAVRGVVALVADPTRCAIKHQPDDIHIAAPGTLGVWLASLPSDLDAHTADRIHALLRRSASWADRRAG